MDSPRQIPQAEDCRIRLRNHAQPVNHPQFLDFNRVQVSSPSYLLADGLSGIELQIFLSVRLDLPVGNSDLIKMQQIWAAMFFHRIDEDSMGIAEDAATG
jgi:hypothetical protein